VKRVLYLNSLDSPVSEQDKAASAKKLDEGKTNLWTGCQDLMKSELGQEAANLRGQVVELGKKIDQFQQKIDKQDDLLRTFKNAAAKIEVNILIHSVALSCFSKDLL